MSSSCRVSQSASTASFSRKPSARITTPFRGWARAVGAIKRLAHRRKISSACLSSKPPKQSSSEGAGTNSAKMSPALSEVPRKLRCSRCLPGNSTTARRLCASTTRQPSPSTTGQYRSGDSKSIEEICGRTATDLRALPTRFAGGAFTLTGEDSDSDHGDRELRRLATLRVVNRRLGDRTAIGAARIGLRKGAKEARASGNLDEAIDFGRNGTDWT
mmetsp:Transcript_32937/g.71907  ORF Transcript_32937/g.71907 Transcript_32937/m.71907 type:complete len:216 (+) Transcript_32937:386-1033(+)